VATTDATGGSPDHPRYPVAVRAILLLSLSAALACGDDSSSTEDAGLRTDAGSEPCVADGDCDDGAYCNGAERCAPDEEGADVRGCVPGDSPCPGLGCDESADACDDSCPDADGDGFADATCGGEDCDDADPDRYPGNVEICDPDDHDEDCDPSTLGREDRDGDGQIAARCCNPDAEGVIVCGADCNDAVPSVFLGATEVCDGYDQDCDGDVDEGVLVSGFADADGDRHGDPATPRMDCPGTAHFSLYDDDCDDTDHDVFGGRPEECNGLDDDCDGAVDESIVDLTFYRDGDGDGFGDPRGETRTACVAPDGFALLPLDCDDADPEASPAADERCNGADDDCDGRPSFRVGPADLEDDDGDGVGDEACGGADCADDDPRVGGGLEEVIDGVDNDCDGAVDDRCVMSAFYVDEDGDGYGSGEATIACEPMGRAQRDGDCDDSDASVGPAARESCNGVDDDCDGAVDELLDAGCGMPGAIGVCREGSCEVELCARGRLDCSDAPGCETSAFEAETCGACETSCDATDASNAVPACVPRDGTPAAECGFACADGFGDCDEDPDNGCERPIGDPNNCGGCDVRCAVPLNSDALCVGGRCMAECSEGYGDCDAAVEGCETELASDPMNCGECGMECAAACVAGRCAAHPFPVDPAADDFVSTPTNAIPSGVYEVGTMTVNADDLVELSGGTGVLVFHASGEVRIDGTIDVSGGTSITSGGHTGQWRFTSGVSCVGGSGGTGEPGERATAASVCGWGGTNGGGSGGDELESGGGGGGFGGGGGGRWSADSGDGGAGGGPEGGAGGFSGGAGSELYGRGGGSSVACYAGADGEFEAGPLPKIGGGGGGSIGSAAAEDPAIESTFYPGSGGGGAAGDFGRDGGGGGGGGGALRITSPVRIVIGATGVLLANGGAGGDPGGGGGSGGVIHLVAPEIVVEGGARISAVGGLGAPPMATNVRGGNGGPGRIRLSVDPRRCVIAGDTNPPTTCGDTTPTPCRGSIGVYPD